MAWLPAWLLAPPLAPARFWQLSVAGGLSFLALWTLAALSGIALGTDLALPGALSLALAGQEVDHRLEQVGECHRPHPAKDGVDQDHGSTHHDGVVQLYGP